MFFSRFFLSLVLFLSLAISAPSPARIPSYAESAAPGVAALYLDNRFPPEQFICTAFVVDKTPSRILLATAKHCFEDREKNDTYSVSFSANMKGKHYHVLHIVVNTKHDIVLLEVASEADMPFILALPVGDETKDFPGDVVSNVTFGYAMGKNVLFGRFVNPVLPHCPEHFADVPDWCDYMWSDIIAIAGSSGSPVFDERQQAVIGILVGSFDGGAIVVPASLLRQMISDTIHI